MINTLKKESQQFLKICFLIYITMILVQNLGRISTLLQLWLQLFKEKLGTHQLLAIKLEKPLNTIKSKAANRGVVLEDTF